MTQPTYRVFVSSTYEDLVAERRAVEEALHRLSDTPPQGMEYFGSRPGTPREESLRAVDRCELFVLLVGGRYGSGITEAEYDRASQLYKPIFVFFKAEQAVAEQHRERDSEQRRRLDAFREKLRSRHIIEPKDFTNPDQLATWVTTAISRWMMESHNRRPADFDSPQTRLSRLPLLANRDPQATRVEECLDQLLDRKSAEGWVFFLHGPRNEEPGDFVERIATLVLPEKLAQRGRPAPSRFERMDWPDASISVEKRLARLHADLRGLLGEGIPDDDSAITHCLEREAVSWVFKYTVDARSWANEDQELLARWSRFWRGLPPVRSGNAMLVFFCIPLRLPSDVGFLHRLFRRDPDQRIRLAIDQLRAEAEQCCLPLLSSIERVHVDRWADTRCPCYCPDLDLDVLREKATASYRDRQAMPYGELKPDLKKALRAASASWNSASQRRGNLG